MECPKCKKQWPWNSEQAVSVEWHDECIGCKRFVISGPEMDLIANESKKRRSGQHLPPSNNLQE